MDCKTLTIAAFSVSGFFCYLALLSFWRQRDLSKELNEQKEKFSLLLRKFNSLVKSYKELQIEIKREQERAQFQSVMSQAKATLSARERANKEGSQQREKAYSPAQDVEPLAQNRRYSQIPQQLGHIRHRSTGERYRFIAALSEKGMASDEIAEILSVSEEEVEQVIALHKQ